MAITDGTAGSGLAARYPRHAGWPGDHVRDAAYLDDGTLAGSVLTMDRAFARLVTQMGFSLVDAALMCATTPAREMGLLGAGVLAAGALADLVVLDRNLNVVETYVAGVRAFSRADGPLDMKLERGTDQRHETSMAVMKGPLSAALLLFGAASVGCTVTVDSHSEVQREEKRFTVTGTPDLRLTTFDGSIQIQSWDKPDVLVEIERRGPTKASLESIEVIDEPEG